MRFLTSNIERAGRDAGPHHLLWWRRASVPAISTYVKAQWYHLLIEARHFIRACFHGSTMTSSPRPA